MRAVGVGDAASFGSYKAPPLQEANSREMMTAARHR